MAIVDDLELEATDRPAIVGLDDSSTELVADHRLLDCGWLRVRDRDDTVRKYPPTSVTEVQPLETEAVEHEDGRRTKRIVEDCTPEMEFLAGVTSA